jgi:hypothetical protein
VSADLGENLEFSVVLPGEVSQAISAGLRDEVMRLLSSTPHQEEWRLWNLSETARRLGRSERWVRERVKEGTLPRIRLDGGALMFDPKDVQSFARARRVPPEERVPLALPREGG